jgi:hypothetical protein
MDPAPAFLRYDSLRKRFITLMRHYATTSASCLPTFRPVQNGIASQHLYIRRTTTAAFPTWSYYGDKNRSMLGPDWQDYNALNRNRLLDEPIVARMRDLAYSPMPLYERTVHTHPMVHYQLRPLAIKPALHEPSNSSQRPHQCTSFSKSNARHPKWEKHSFSKATRS